MDIELEIQKIDGELQELYRGKSTNVIRLKQLWDRLDVLERMKASGDQSGAKRVIG